MSFPSKVWTGSLVLSCFLTPACSAENKAAEPTIITDKNSEVAVVSGGAMGTIPDHFSPQTLGVFEDAANRKYRELALQSGLQLPSNAQISSSAEVVRHARSNLIKISTDYGEKVVLLQFIGSIDGIQKSVVCASIEQAPFRYANSSCEASVADSFGDPLDSAR